MLDAVIHCCTPTSSQGSASSPCWSHRPKGVASSTYQHTDVCRLFHVCALPMKTHRRSAATSEPERSRQGTTRQGKIRHGKNIQLALQILRVRLHSEVASYCSCTLQASMTRTRCCTFTCNCLGNWAQIASPSAPAANTSCNIHARCLN